MDEGRNERVDEQQMRIEELEERIRLLTLENIELKKENKLKSPEEFFSAGNGSMDQKVDAYFDTIVASGDIASTERIDFLMNHLINGILTMRYLTMKQENSSSLVVKVFARVMETIAKDLANITKLPNSFPVAWLLQQYPVTNEFYNSNKLNWLSHIQHWFFLCCSSSYNSSNYDLGELFDDDSIYNSICSKFNDEMSSFSVGVGVGIPNEDLITDFLSRYPAVAKKQDTSDGAIPIFHAVANNNNVDCVKLLSQYSQDVIQTEDNFGFNVLNYACYSGRYSVCKFLFERFPYVKQPIFPLLNDAAVNINGGVDLIKLVFDKFPASLSTCDEFGAYPIHLASEFNSLEVVRYLIELNPNSVYLTDEESLLPLHYAGKRKDKDLTVVDYLVSLNPHGIDLNELKKQSTTGSAVTNVSNIFNKLIDGIKSKNNNAAPNPFPVVVTPSIVATENKPVKRTSVIGQKKRNSSIHTRDVIEGVSQNRQMYDIE